MHPPLVHDKGVIVFTVLSGPASEYLNRYMHINTSRSDRGVMFHSAKGVTLEESTNLFHTSPS